MVRQKQQLHLRMGCMDINESVRMRNDFFRIHINKSVYMRNCFVTVVVATCEWALNVIGKIPTVTKRLWVNN